MKEASRKKRKYVEKVERRDRLKLSERNTGRETGEGRMVKFQGL